MYILQLPTILLDDVKLQNISVVNKTSARLNHGISVEKTIFVRNKSDHFHWFRINPPMPLSPTIQRLIKFFTCIFNELKEKKCKWDRQFLYYYDTNVSNGEVETCIEIKWIKNEWAVRTYAHNILRPISVISLR